MLLQRGIMLSVVLLTTLLTGCATKTLPSDEIIGEAYGPDGSVIEGRLTVSAGVYSKLLKCCNACLDKSEER